jgi:hypothetical protein
MRSFPTQDQALLMLDAHLTMQPNFSQAPAAFMREARASACEN